MICHSIEKYPFTIPKEEVIYKFLLSTEELDPNQVQVEEFIGELVPHQFLEDLQNVFSFSKSIVFNDPTAHQVMHKRFKGFPPFKAWSGQEPPFKHSKVFRSYEWVHMHFKRSSQRFAGIFAKPYVEKQFT